MHHTSSLPLLRSLWVIRSYDRSRTRLKRESPNPSHSKHVRNRAGTYVLCASVMCLPSPALSPIKPITTRKSPTERGPAFNNAPCRTAVQHEAEEDGCVDWEINSISPRVVY
ncbi:hypothetical protein BV22DRAFT_903449 [Leucogyrophana mollusca]|uniref:Uncharacterized protein n=1 Tax=Leucogyrophana mollusca TaxID=85980 RepID=A0ACB8AZ78_9AGAM|nr:hypothetical protein BV22DRAFT_903449 [Leucogyrophana mollusca]